MDKSSNWLNRDLLNAKPWISNQSMGPVWNGHCSGKKQKGIIWHQEWQCGETNDKPSPIYIYILKSHKITIFAGAMNHPQMVGFWHWVTHIMRSLGGWRRSPKFGQPTTSGRHFYDSVYVLNPIINSSPFGFMELGIPPTKRMIVGYGSPPLCILIGTVDQTPVFSSQSSNSWLIQIHNITSNRHSLYTE